MAVVYAINSNFEFELEGKEVIVDLQRHPICLQLQFLPLLFADKDDAVVVTAIPEGITSLPKLFTYEAENIYPKNLVSWGWSRSLANWAKEKGLHYNMPSWDVVRQVNSKQWSFENSPQLPGSALIYSEDHLKVWLKQGPCVLKSCFGLSGRGHYHSQEGKLTEKMLAFCHKEWSKKLPIIAEPWVERFLDFSTQWYVDEKISLIGVTRMLNSSLGAYEGTIVGDEEIPLLAQHKVEALKILQKAKDIGYFGFVGIDAMIYEKDKLHPIVEVNARMTMALMALWIREKKYPNKRIKVVYERFSEGVLPNQLNSQTKFNRQLSITII